MITSGHSRRGSEEGYSLVELIVAVGITTVIMGATMTGLSNAVRANEAVVMVTGMNEMLRTGMDLMVRDLLQVGSGLPPGHVIGTPSGDGSGLINLPGPPDTAFTNTAGDTDIAAIVPGTGKGPKVNGVDTDTIIMLMADNTFTDVDLAAVTDTTVNIDPDEEQWTPTGADRVTPGQLMMLTKGSYSTLVQVTAVDVGARRLTFGSGDSLNLNQDAEEGSLAALNDADPVDSPANTRVSRVRMISYYIDATVPGRPRLVRRINNGDPTTFDNKLGTAVGLDIENLQITYDLAGNTNPSNVRFTGADLAANGTCGAEPCSATQIRKVNVALTARSRNANVPKAKVHRNTLTSQVSLRGMAFVNEYKAPE